MKKYLPIIILLIASLMLPSCVGIGDGALKGANHISSPEKTVCGGTELLHEKDDPCVINVFNSEGHSSYIARPDSEAQAKLRGLLEKGAYTAGADTSSTGGTYIRVLFTDEGGAQEAYLVYTNNVVKYSNSLSDSFTSLGTLEGIYWDVRSFGDEANKAKSEASSRAGYSVSDLIVTVKSGHKPKLTDYAEFDCIGIFQLMALNTGETMYTFHFDSDTKERIDEIMTSLQTYSSISSVSYNYIVTFD